MDILVKTGLPRSCACALRGAAADFHPAGDQEKSRPLQTDAAASIEAGPETMRGHGPLF